MVLKRKKKPGNLYSHKIFNPAFIKATYYYENGEVESTGEEKMRASYANTFVKKGLWKYYHENGNKKEEGVWGMGGRHGKHNVQKGTWKYYNDEGELMTTKEYNDMGMTIKK